MADQTVRVSNLPDSGSPERVAFDLYCAVRTRITATPSTSVAQAAQRHLALYEQCLNATRGQPFDTSKLT